MEQSQDTNILNSISQKPKRGRPKKPILQSDTHISDTHISDTHISYTHIKKINYIETHNYMYLKPVDFQLSPHMLWKSKLGMKKLYTENHKYDFLFS